MKTKMKKLIQRVEALERVVNKQASLILKQSLTINNIVDKQLSGANEAIAVKPEEPKHVNVGRYKPEVNHRPLILIQKVGREADLL